MPSCMLLSTIILILPVNSYFPKHRALGIVGSSGILLLFYSAVHIQWAFGEEWDGGRALGRSRGKRHQMEWSDWCWEMGVPFPCYCGMGGPGLDRGPQLSPGQLCTGAGQDRIVGRCSDLFPRHFLCERGRMLKTTNCYDLPSQRLCFSSIPVGDGRTYSLRGCKT